MPSIMSMTFATFTLVIVGIAIVESAADPTPRLRCWEKEAYWAQNYENVRMNKTNPFCFSHDWCIKRISSDQRGDLRVEAVCDSYGGGSLKEICDKEAANKCHRITGVDSIIEYCCCSAHDCNAVEWSEGRRKAGQPSYETVWGKPYTPKVENGGVTLSMSNLVVVALVAAIKIIA